MDPPRIDPGRPTEPELAWSDKTDMVREIATALNALLASFFALFVKTKNFWWHVSEPNFAAHSSMFGEQANQLQEGLDLLAERAVRSAGRRSIQSSPSFVWPGRRAMTPRFSRRSMC
jgi:DNA-binding ferritin-like protein